MDVKEAIAKRYSCRAYLPKPIEKEKLAQLLEAARLAPSAKNLQDWRFVVVTDPTIKEKMMHAANEQKFIPQAPAIIAACSNSDHVMTCGQKVAAIDIAIALEHIALRATELGLATCWLGSFYPDKVRKVLSIPEDIEIVDLMTIGYPADEKPQMKRLDQADIVCYDKWSF